MTDAELNVHLMAVLSPRATVDPVLSQFTSLKFLQNFDPTQQGRDATAVVYFVKISHKRYGWAKRRDRYVPTEPTPAPPAPLGTMAHEESQIIEQTYQFMTLVPQDNTRPLLPTPSDVLDAVAGIINSDRGMRELRARGVAVLRITDVRNPYLPDDKDHFEASPSFDVVFQHERIRSDVDQVVTAYEAKVQRV